MMGLEPTTFCMASGSWNRTRRAAGTAWLSGFSGALPAPAPSLKFPRFAVDLGRFGH